MISFKIPTQRQFLNATHQSSSENQSVPKLSKWFSPGRSNFSTREETLDGVGKLDIDFTSLQLHAYF
jgi:hypothetical protein